MYEMIYLYVTFKKTNEAIYIYIYFRYLETSTPRIESHTTTPQIETQTTTHRIETQTTTPGIEMQTTTTRIENQKTTYIETHTTTPRIETQTTTPTRHDAITKSCTCTCGVHEVITNYDLVRSVPVINITEPMTIDKKKLSSSRRKLTSAKDDRTSATVVGYTGIVVLTLVLGTIVISDIVNYLICPATKSRP